MAVLSGSSSGICRFTLYAALPLTLLRASALPISAPTAERFTTASASARVLRPSRFRVTVALSYSLLIPAVPRVMGTTAPGLPGCTQFARALLRVSVSRSSAKSPYNWVSVGQVGAPFCLGARA